jgi:hypothetical protein
MGAENRKHDRVVTAIPVRFNLNPRHHIVPEIRKMGVAGAVNDISPEGLGIDAEMNLLDLCQIFPETIDEGSPFALELLMTDPEKGKVIIRGEVSWYRVDQPESDRLHFQAGLHLENQESRTFARRLSESASRSRETTRSYEGFLDLRGFRVAPGSSIRNTGDKTVNRLIIETRCLSAERKVIHQKLYRVIPCGETRRFGPGETIQVVARDRGIPSSVLSVKVLIREIKVEQSG